MYDAGAAARGVKSDDDDDDDARSCSRYNTLGLNALPLSLPPWLNALPIIVGVFSLSSLLSSAAAVFTFTKPKNNGGVNIPRNSCHAEASPTTSLLAALLDADVAAEAEFKASTTLVMIFESAASTKHSIEKYAVNAPA